MQGKVEICGVNTADLPVLKWPETRTLLEKSRAGDMEAREKLISGNLRLVLSVVQKFAGRGESMDDLFQVGVIGLIKAVDCFDLNQNVQFSTYGVPTVNGWREAACETRFASKDSRSSRCAWSARRQNNTVRPFCGVNTAKSADSIVLPYQNQSVRFGFERRQSGVNELSALAGSE